jgi:hypothetical protein
MYQVLENGESLVTTADLGEMASVYLENPATRTLQEIRCEGKGTWEVVRVVPEKYARMIVADKAKRERTKVPPSYLIVKYALFPRRRVKGHSIGLAQALWPRSNARQEFFVAGELNCDNPK